MTLTDRVAKRYAPGKTLHTLARSSAGGEPTPRRRAFFFLLPNLAEDSELDVYAFRLLAHYQRVAGFEGTCAESTATTAAQCRMSPRRVVQARSELVAGGWIAVSHFGAIGQQVAVVSVVDRMSDNLARYDRSCQAATPGQADTPAPGAAPARIKRSSPLHLVQALPEPAVWSPVKTPEDSGTPPIAPQPNPPEQQQGDGIELTETSCSSAAPSRDGGDETAGALVTAFYRGLGSTPMVATAAMQRRDVAIARQLVAAGATPDEAEAYARQSSGLEGRLAPIDLRSFERERPAWLVRHRRQERRHVDRSGLPPTWMVDAPSRVPSVAPPPLPAPLPAPLSGTPDRTVVGVPGVLSTSGGGLAGARLAQALRAVVLDHS